MSAMREQMVGSDVNKERIKLICLTVSFFFIIGAYTLAKELKDIVFNAIVGKEYIWIAKLAAIFLLIPSIVIYSKFVDTLRRYQLLALYSLMYGIVGLVFAVLLGSATIGLPNTNTDPYRMFGWFFYFFVEGYSPFVVSVFWAFANSINSPESAKNNYATMVSGSKIGGMVTAGLAWALLRVTDVSSIWMLSDTMRHQVLLAVASFMLIVVPGIIYFMVNKVSRKYLHDTEASGATVLAGKEKAKTTDSSSAGVISGLRMLIQYPYVFGIFCIVLFYEIIQTILSYQRICIATDNAKDLSSASAYLFAIMFVTHAVGLAISAFGTRSLLQRWGEKVCLLLVPLSTAVLFLYFRISGTQQAFLIFLVALRAIHYAFSYPVRESLYIVTVKDVQFKSKSWIDAFGGKFAKSVGSIFNGLTSNLSTLTFIAVQSTLFTGIIGLWIVAAFLLGARFERAATKNEVIGA